MESVRQSIYNVLDPAEISKKLFEIERRIRTLEGTWGTKPVIYLGPSLKQGIASQILDADYRPPIKRGDLAQAIDEGHRMIGIVDGMFHQNLAVSVREIHEAIDRGARIYGGASMGAMRAAEAHKLGMVGVGQVYSWYRNGAIESDDEVSLCFDEASGKVLTEPLVNIRATLEQALKEKVIAEGAKEQVIAAAKEIHFSERSYPLILARLKGKLTPEELDCLKNYFSQQSVNLKSEDAIELLRQMKKDYEHFGAVKRVSC